MWQKSYKGPESVIVPSSLVFLSLKSFITFVNESIVGSMKYMAWNYLNYFLIQSNLSIPIIPPSIKSITPINLSNTLDVF